jgi:hypothetical protein
MCERANKSGEAGFGGTEMVIKSNIPAKRHCEFFVSYRDLFGWVRLLSVGKNGIIVAEDLGVE